MADVRFFRAAEVEYWKAFAWYVDQSPRAAEGFQEEVAEALKRIGRSPSQFPAYDEVHRFYKLHRYPYLLYYRSDVLGVAVVAVAHERRKPGYWKKRR